MQSQVVSMKHMYIQVTLDGLNGLHIHTYIHKYTHTHTEKIQRETHANTYVAIIEKRLWIG